MSNTSEIFDLNKKRETLEEEASAITDELTASIDGKEPMGISTPLVDTEGYPRADIDVYRARHLRKRLNEIKFDHSLLMKKIEEKFIQNNTAKSKGEIDARTKKKPKPKFDPVTKKWVVRNWDGSCAGVENGDSRSFDNIGSDAGITAANFEKAININSATGTNANSNEQPETKNPPFAKIENVMMGSPAKEAGLMKDDLIISFGTIDYSNNRNLRALGEIVKNAHMDGNGVSVLVARTSNGTERLLRLKLKPHEWNGKGLVGCTFSPTKIL